MYHNILKVINNNQVVHETRVEILSVELIIAIYIAFLDRADKHNLITSGNN
jgi:hypothetical protein